MISRAVFSYFNPDESFTNTAGFRTYADMLYTMALSACMAMRHFPEVQIVTSSWGEKIFREAGILASEYNTALDDIQKIPRAFWAYGKLIAYSIQTRPFVHLDNDVFLWTPLPPRILNAELCFQSREYFDRPGYEWYDVLRPCWNAAPVRPEIIIQNPVEDFTYNCGICGGNRLEFFKEWIHCSGEYIFAPENQDTFFKDFRDILMHQNLWHEQYFAASLVKAYGLRDQTEILADSVSDLKDPVWRANNKIYYTHLWGVTKQQSVDMQKVRMRLLRENPQIYAKVTQFTDRYLFNECQKENIGAVAR